MDNNHSSKPTSLPLRSALHIATSLALGTMAQTAAADIYVLGASYTSLNPGVYAAPVGSGDPAGNVTATNGDTWIALLAAATSIGQPRPVSSAIAPAAGETATNFARGGAEIINSLPGTAGIDRPKDASEQFAELQTALGTGSPAASDIFAITAFANDIVYQYESGTQGNVTTAFIDQRVAKIKQIIESAITTLGFTKVLVANMPRIDLLPGIDAMMNPSVLNALKADVDYYNQQANTMLNTLATAYSGVTFMLSDVASVFANVTANPATYNFVDATSTTYDATGAATGADPTTVMWWDGFNPTQALHQQIANNVAAYQPPPPPAQTTTSASGGGGAFGLTGLLALLLSCLPMTIMRSARSAGVNEESRS